MAGGTVHGGNAGKLGGAVAPLVAHLSLSEPGGVAIAGCVSAAEALERLEGAGLLEEAVRLIAHALPKREAVWWAAMCAQHTRAVQGGADEAACTAAELWVRKPTEENRRAAMMAAQATGFQSAEAWAAVAAFWTGDTMAPPEAPKVPPGAHFTGLAVAGSVAIAAARGQATRREARLRAFLASAREIGSGGTGRLEAETG